MEPTAKFTIERIDEKTARKKDNTESITILNMDVLRQQKEELEQEVDLKQRSLTEISEIISEFDKLPVPPKNESVAEPEVGEQPVPSEEAPVDDPEK
jgi:hypothetical protein